MDLTLTGQDASDIHTPNQAVVHTLPKVGLEEGTQEHRAAEGTQEHRAGEGRAGGNTNWDTGFLQSNKRFIVCIHLMSIIAPLNLTKKV